MDIRRLLASAALAAAAALASVTTFAAAAEAEVISRLEGTPESTELRSATGEIAIRDEAEGMIV